MGRRGNGARGGETGAVVGSRDVRADIGIALGRRATFAPGNTEPPLLRSCLSLSVPRFHVFSFFLSFFLPSFACLACRLACLLCPGSSVFYGSLFFSCSCSFLCLHSAPLKYSRFRDHACRCLFVRWFCVQKGEISRGAISMKFERRVLEFVDEGRWLDGLARIFIEKILCTKLAMV